MAEALQSRNGRDSGSPRSDPDDEDGLRWIDHVLANRVMWSQDDDDICTPKGDVDPAKSILLDRAGGNMVIATEPTPEPTGARDAPDLGP